MPRDPKRISKILNILKQIWKMNPDLRLGQLILNAVNEEDLYYMEDDKILEKIVSTYSQKEEIDDFLKKFGGNNK